MRTTEGRDGYDPTMTDMPPLPPPTPSIKLTLEGLATLLGLKVCSHGDLGFAFGSGPVLASHEAATVIREVVANLRARAREEGEAAESLRAQLGETSNMLAEVSEILHRAWPEHMSGDPVQLARAAVEAVTSAEAMRAETLAEGREQAGAARLEIAALRERLDTTNYHMQQHIAESNGIRKRLGELLDAPATEDYDQIAARICDLLEIRDRYTAVKVRAEADELEIKKLLESLRVSRSAENARTEEVDTLLKMIDTLAPKLPSCSEPHVDRLARAHRKIAAEVAAIPRPAELEEIRKILGAVWPAMEISTREARPTDALELARAAAAEIARLTAPRGVDDSIEPVRVLSPIHEPPELRRGSARASGLDLPVRLGVSLAPGRTVRVPTGVKVAIPEGFEGQVRPRSSAAARGILVHLGTIDPDYRGEIDVVVTNLSGEWVAIDKPIAQLVICPVAHPPMEYVETLDDTARGEGGFGSSDAIAGEETK